MYKIGNLYRCLKSDHGLVVIHDSLEEQIKRNDIRGHFLLQTDWAETGKGEVLLLVDVLTSEQPSFNRFVTFFAFLRSDGKKVWDYVYSSGEYTTRYFFWHFEEAGHGI